MSVDKHSLSIVKFQCGSHHERILRAEPGVKKAINLGRALAEALEVEVMRAETFSLARIQPRNKQLLQLRFHAPSSTQLSITCGTTDILETVLAHSRIITEQESHIGAG
jgi:hypothetical protein